MMPALDEFVTAIVFSFLTTLILAFTAFRYRYTPGTKYFIMTMFMCAIMSLASLGEILSTDLHTKLVWRNIQQIPLFSFPVFILAFVLDYLGKRSFLTLKRMILLALPNILYILFIYTDGYHHWMRNGVQTASTGNVELTTVEITGLSLAFIIYNNALNFAAFTIFALNFRNTSTYNKTPYLLLLIGLALPVFFAVIRPFLPVGIWSSTAVSFIPSSLLLFLGLMKFRLLSLWPVAKDTIIENLKDGIVLIDKEDTIIEMNFHAREWLQNRAGVSGTLQTGTNLYSLLNPLPEVQTFIAAKQKGQLEIHLVTKEEETYFDVSMFPIAGRNGQTTGFLIMVTDITADKTAKNLLWEQAVTDPLTRLPNRQYFFEQAEKVKEGDRDSEISFILLDIDDFKKINDTYGHHIGDEVLIRFSKMLQQMDIPYRIAARLGGEEFALLLTGTAREDTRSYGEYVCREIAGSPISISDKLSITVTVSLGISSDTAGSASIERMYREADAVLYYSKRHGKNQVSFHT
ncbi:histidine kinase N-terminal 7TM domain-containing diguanylate cyclase [Salibacterium aidingense]|uniref:histidine kinase N-terminal 7TM domain-containing diguanylate cyclase n=1 Tax=Salibacterium aidingense TaxID=384933 RepID=UPI00047A8B9C|nr:diguanylate cyclase [Salibacterium aidingense]